MVNDAYRSYRTKIPNQKFRKIFVNGKQPLKHETNKTERSTNHESKTRPFWTRASKHVFPKMTDGTENPKFLRIPKRTARYNEFRCNFKIGTQDFTDPGLLKIRLTLTGLSLWFCLHKCLRARGVWHLQTADCRPQIADCKLNDTKNLPNKGDVINNITSCGSEKVAWEQGWYFCAKLQWPHSQDPVGYSSTTLYQLTRHITNCVDSLFFFDYCELIITSSNAR